MLSYIFLISACVIIPSTESYIYVMAMSKCMKINLLSISKNAEDKVEIREKFIEFIEFDSRVKQLSSLIFSFADRNLKEIFIA